MSRSLPHLSTQAVLVALGLLALLGCNREGRPGHHDGLPEPPNLGGRYVDDGGVARTPVDLRAVVEVGEAATGDLPARGILAGYEFEAFRGSEMTADLEVFERGGEVGLAFYGPRTTTGLWDSALASAEGRTPGLVTASTEGLPAAGTYLVLIYSDRPEVGPRYELTLSCKGNCGAPACPDMVPCNLVCDHGFVPDAAGCRTCGCQEAPQCGEGIGDCPAGQICGADGRCGLAPQPPPECAEERPVCDTTGQTWPNRCAAERAERQVKHEGECPVSSPPECDREHACAPPLVCQAGTCIRPSCDCPGPDAPVCSMDGETWRNLCELECHQGAEALAYHGPCQELRPCREGADCPDGRSCVPVRERDNLRVCEADPDDPDCQRVCVMAAPAAFCGEGLPECPADTACYRGHATTGPCVLRCALEGESTCPAGTLCAAVRADGLAEHEGVCLPGCRPGAPNNCPPLLSCLPEGEHRGVCQLCDCPPAAPGEEVCTDQQAQFPSACLAECAHAANWRPGRCEDEPVCECPDVYAPVCAPDGHVLNRCEARCELPPETPVRDLAACLPLGTVVEFACRNDEGCTIGGCNGSLCAATPLRVGVCPPISDELSCYSRGGECGCVNNRCAFQITREVLRCVEALDGAEGPPAHGDEPPPDRE